MDHSGQTVRSRAVEEGELGGVVMELTEKTRRLGATHSRVRRVSK